MGNYLNIDLKGKKIKLLEEYVDERLNQKETFEVTGGFGASPVTEGTALFIKSTKTGEEFRINGYDKIELIEE